MYFSGIYYFSTHFLPGRTFQGIDIGLKTEAEVSNQLYAEVMNQTRTIQTVADSITVTNEQLGLSFNSEQIAKQAMDVQNQWLWIFEMFQKKELDEDISYTVNDDVLKDTLFAIGVTNPEGKTEAQNAEIKKEDNGFTIIEEREGTLLDESQVLAIVKQHAISGENIIDVSSAKQMPEVFVKDLEAIVNRANHSVGAIYTLKIRETVLTIPKETVAAAVSIIDNTLTVDRQVFVDYLNSLVAEYTIMGSAGVLDTTNMQTSGGIDGSTIDVATTAAAIEKVVSVGETAQIEATIIKVESPTQISGVGDTYIQISLTEQHMWYYEQGQLVLETPIISGDDTQGWGTITGVYSIMAKERDAVLEGYAYGWDYSVPVNFWMPIYTDGTGLHDATWQSDFGGKTYLGGGSHGCVNLPYNIAEQLFNRVTVGTPVVIYK